VPSTQASAQTCGDIISTNPYSGETEQVSIEDCANPFAPNISAPSDIDIVIDGISVPSGASEVAIPTEFFRYVDFNFTLKSGGGFGYYPQLFEKLEEDYKEINLRLPTRDDITQAEGVALLEEYFSGDPDLPLYRQAYIDDNEASLTVDQETKYRGFIFDFLPERLLAEYGPRVPVGEYWFLFTEQAVCLTKQEQNNSWLGILLALLTPTANAQSGASCAPGYIPERFVVQLNITQEIAEPEGASSVLFLPGIQASRLYKERTIVFEDQLWPPGPEFGNGLLKLQMDEDGVSIEDVYTRDVIESVFGVGDIHRNLFEFLDNQTVSPQLPIKEFSAFAYDWRYDVVDIIQNGTQYEDEVKSLIDELENLQTDSYTDKVTIIAHSNGGLLAKALMFELESQQKESYVDKIVFIGVPQLGTPKGLLAVLHGYGQQDEFGGLFLGSEVVRKVLNNMPGAYMLMPSAAYITQVQEPIISFDNSLATKEYRELYGANISSLLQYTNFMNGNDILQRDINQDDSVPVRVNNQMLTEALEKQEYIESWVAPDGIEVIEIVGTGLPTAKSVRYRDILEEICTGNTESNTTPICVTDNIMKGYVSFTGYGDGTVVQNSSTGYEGQKQVFYVNVPQIEEATSISIYEHFNLTEIPQVQDIIKNVLRSTSSQIEFVTDQPVELAQVYDIEMIDSPVNVLAIDAEGNKTGVQIEGGVKTIYEDIPKSQFVEIADTKYLIIPAEVERTTTLTGLDYGGFTLTFASLEVDDVQVINHTISNATTTPQMVGSYNKKDGEYSLITVDYENDGIIDSTFTVDGIIQLEPEEATYDVLRQSLINLDLRRSYERWLLKIVQKAERYHLKSAERSYYKKIEKLLLRVIKNRIRIASKLDWISDEQKTEVDAIINELKND